MQTPSTDTPVSTDRRTLETSQWNASLEAYRKAKEDGWNGVTQRGHPLEQWVHKQRRLYKMGLLQEWKCNALRDVRFDFVSPTEAATPTNTMYAKELVAFYAKHGHYIPTQTFAGAGLTKWWKKMQESNGTVGLVAQSSGSAQEALAILKLGIPGFDLHALGKADLNIAEGRSFNGFIRSTRNKGPWVDHEVVVASDKFGKDAAIAAQDLQALGYASSEERATREVLMRAAFFSQVARADLNGVHVGWVTGVKLEGRRYVLSCSTEVGGQRFSRTVATGRLVSVAYSKAGERYEATYQDEQGDILVLGYDALLADQSSCLDTNQLDGPAECLIVASGAVHWNEWMAGHGPQRRHSPATTANRHFEQSFAALKGWVSDQQRLLGDGRRPHITWSQEREQYKFLEHIVLKRRNGTLAFSHAERLLSIDATWGSDHLQVAEMVGINILWDSGW